jgi:hypothetical protein
LQGSREGELASRTQGRGSSWERTNYEAHMLEKTSHPNKETSSGSLRIQRIKPLEERKRQAKYPQWVNLHLACGKDEEVRKYTSKIKMSNSVKEEVENGSPTKDRPSSIGSGSLEKDNLV